MPTDLPIVLVGPQASDLTRRLLADSAVAEVLDGVAELRLSRSAGGSSAFTSELADADALLLDGRLDAEWLGDDPRIRLVSVPATGYAFYVDAPRMSELGIDVAYVPSYGAAAVAEHALALILAVAKNVVPAHRAVLGGGWPQQISVQLDGGTAGVVGFGDIGLRVARSLEALGMDVLVWTRRRDPGRLAGARARYVSLQELFDRSDVVSLHLALTPETRGLVDADLLGRARPGLIVVNTARAELIHPGALEELTRSGQVRAALDVLTEEPPGSALLSSLSQDTLLTPHVAYLTDAALASLMAATVENIRGFFAGCPANLVRA